MSPTREELDRRHEHLANALGVSTTEPDESVLPQEVLDAIDRLPAPTERERQWRNDSESESDNEKE